MYKVNDYVVYKKDVCKIIEIRKNHLYNKDYYILIPIKDESLKIELPIDDKNEFIRNVISKKEIEELIKKIPTIENITDTNEKLLEYHYKELIKNGTHEDLIKIIKTTYCRNQDRKNNGKKENAKDHTYFEIAEGILYNEFSIALNLTYDDTKKYIIDKVDYLLNN